MFFCPWLLTGQVGAVRGGLTLGNPPGREGKMVEKIADCLGAVVILGLIFVAMWL